jgi:thiol:disulfide interchange protein DsbD
MPRLLLKTHFLLICLIVFSFEAYARQESAVSANLEMPGVQMTLVGALFFALAGGLILNLMPCVFPILSVKALSAVKLAGERPALAAVHGLAYTLGILVMFALVAGTLIGLKEAGAHIGWGFQLQNPVVITLLAWLLFLIGLNLSGAFEFGGGLGTLGGRVAGSKGIAESFLTGLLATIVATPCTAPFMGAALGFALTQDTAIAMSVFLALGLGLALPFLLLSLIPPLQKLLPRPGEWMVTFRQFLAFPMFASSVWLVWVLSQQAGPQGVIISLGGMTAFAFAVWLFGKRPERGAKRYALNFLAFLAIFASIVSLPLVKTAPSVFSSPFQGEELKQTQPWSREKLESLLKGDDPVFVEMTAAWCITCKVNHKVALDIPKTRKLFADNKVRYLVGDWTSYREEITTYLEEHGRSGVPFYVYYGGRDEKTGKRSEPLVLPQILTPAVMEGVITQE